MSEKTVEAVQTILGSPISPEFPDTALKVRRNLLVASLVSIVVVLGRVSIDPEYPIFGFKFVGLSESSIRFGLVIVVAYLLVHFTWYVFDEFAGWRVRVTGTRVAFVTTAIAAHEDADYPNDPRQSTLYRWWYENAKRVGQLGVRIEDDNRKIELYKDALKSFVGTPKDAGNLQNVIKAASQAQHASIELKRSVDHLVEIFESQRVTASLQRFDKWFEYLLRSENLRWLLVDAFAPLCAGVVALYFLICGQG
jgi:hypothetical protein